MYRPLVSFAALVLAGIVWQAWRPLPAAILVPGLALLAVTAWSALVCRRPTVVMALLCAGAVLGGAGWWGDRSAALPRCHIANLADGREVVVEAVIVSPVEVQGDGVRMVMAPQSVHTRQSSRAVTGLLQVRIDRATGVYHRGDRVRTRMRLRQPRNFANPGNSDYVTRLARRGILVTSFLSDDRAVVVITPTRNRRAVWLDRYRSRVRLLIGRCMPEAEAALLGTLLLGERGALVPRIRRDFDRLGLSHLLAISGLHVGLVAALGYGVVWLILRMVPSVLLYVRGRAVAWAGAAVPVVGYVLLAGCHMPVLRAGVMLIVGIGVCVLDRRVDLLSSLALAVLVVVLWMPWAVFESSFQLSCTAVLALVVCVPALQPKLEGVVTRAIGSVLLRRVGRWLVLSCTASCVAVLGTLPLCLDLFHRLTPAGPLATAITVPLVGLGIVLPGLSGAACAGCCEPLAAICLRLAGWAAGELLCLVAQWARLPGLAWPAAGMPAPALPAYYGLLLSLPWWLRSRWRLLGAAVVAGLVWGAVLCAPFIMHDRDALQVVFLDVGDGDAAVALLPDRRSMLIDAGGLRSETFDVGERVVVPALYRLGVRRLDYLVLSHPHHDHMGGMAAVLRHFRPRELWLHRAACSGCECRALLQQAQHMGVRVVDYGRVSLSRRLGEVRVCVHGAGAATPDCNDGSLVMTLDYQGRRVLFTGDITWRREQALLAAGAPLAADVLKLPHHGRRGSASERFLARVSPAIAVCSSRRGPCAAVRAWCRQAGTRLYGTGSDGAVRIICRDDGVQVSCHGRRRGLTGAGSLD